MFNMHILCVCVCVQAKKIALMVLIFDTYTLGCAPRSQNSKIRILKGANIGHFHLNTQIGNCYCLYLVAIGYAGNVLCIYSANTNAN